MVVIVINTTTCICFCSSCVCRYRSRNGSFSIKILSFLCKNFINDFFVSVSRICIFISSFCLNKGFFVLIVSLSLIVYDSKVGRILTDEHSVYYSICSNGSRGHEGTEIQRTDQLFRFFATSNGFHMTLKLTMVQVNRVVASRVFCVHSSSTNTCRVEVK